MDILDGIAKRIAEEESKARGPQRLTDLLALSHVPRWSIVDHVRPQSVADHTFRVLVIATELANRAGVSFSVALMYYVLSHDVDESRTGDIPSPAKDRMEVFPTKFCPWYTTPPISQDEHRIFSLADLIEAATFIDKYGLGDHAERVVYSLKTKIFASCPDAWREAVEEMMKEIEEDAGR